MGINQAELVIARRNTAAFINADSITVILNRPVRVASGTGGWIESTPLVLTEQTFRLVPTSTRAGDQSYRTPDGSFNETREELVGMPSSDVHKGDWFINPADQLIYTVIHVSPERSYRCSAWVIQRGPDARV